ncbi:hypothetical protein [Cupriavidus numazuensis]|uniref:hypothetical protein n=1 Tax=Cupriavidus numazuensis TaxID=221992 RepID=UPI001BA89109|nr:hypothetical protein [Cupriavidus numazuensis]
MYNALQFFPARLVQCRIVRPPPRFLTQHMGWLLDPRRVTAALDLHRFLLLTQFSRIWLFYHFGLRVTMGFPHCNRASEVLPTQHWRQIHGSHGRGGWFRRRVEAANTQSGELQGRDACAEMRHLKC